MNHNEKTTWTVGTILNWTQQFFADRKVDEPRLSAELLLAHVLKCRRIELYMRYDCQPTSAQRKTLRPLVARRANHEPIAYLIGKAQFFSLEFAVSPAVLIPRPETELIVDEVLKETDFVGHRAADRPLDILDLGTGSGCIAVSLAVHRPGARIVATDISPPALQIAQTNAKTHNVADRITFLPGDLYSALPEGSHEKKPFEFILANPPYVAEANADRVSPSVRRYEPASAVFAGTRGADFHQRIIAGTGEYLAPGGLLLMEIGEDQADIVSEMIHQADDLADSILLTDSTGRPRVVRAQAERE